MNVDKTERTVAKHDSEEWKNTVLLGSKLGTSEDIKRRKSLASVAWEKYSFILTNKGLPLTLRLNYFVTFVNSIFLYNCGLWTLTVKLEHQIDTFQRAFLRKILGITYPRKITNVELYKVTQQEPWSTVCRKRRITLFGHTCRLPQGAPARSALLEALKPTKHTVGGQKLTYIRLIKKDLKRANITLENAVQVAQNKHEFRALVRRVMSC